jgi:ketosteroid isomerase-like protein
VEKDIEAALAIWAEDAVAMAHGVPVADGINEIRDLYELFFSDQLKEFGSTRTKLVVSKAGDLAYEYGINRLVLAGEDGDLLDMGKYLAVWKKVEGEWFIGVVCLNSDAPTPIPIESE